MAKKQKNGSGSGKNTAAVHMLIEGIAIAVIAVVFIIFSRGYINYSNRMDFIARRLEAYPRMRENHLSELEQMQTLWLTSEYNSLARQAAFLYDRSDAQSDEAEKLGHISEMLGTAKVSVIPAAGQESPAEAAETPDPDMAFALLADGRGGSGQQSGGMGGGRGGSGQQSGGMGGGRGGSGQQSGGAGGSQGGSGQQSGGEGGGRGGKGQPSGGA